MAFFVGSAVSVAAICLAIRMLTVGNTWLVRASMALSVLAIAVLGIVSLIGG